MKALHCAVCALKGRWRRCVACRRPICAKHSTPESGRMKIGGARVPWRCMSCGVREVQQLDFDGEAATQRILKLARDGLSFEKLQEVESPEAITRALLYMVQSEILLPDVVEAVNQQQEKEMRWLAAFAGAERIEFREVRDGLDETYVLKKRGRTLVIHVKGGRGEAKLRVEDPGPV